MNYLRDILISPEFSILDAMKVLDETAMQVLLVVDEHQVLLGSVTDGDFRRGILANIDMKAAVCEVMNKSPLTVSLGTSRSESLTLMQQAFIHCLPVVNELGKVFALETETKLLWQGVKDTWVVLMAGGLGMRLRPLTEHTPKPLLKVDGKPILENILERFIEQGFRNFFISVNYKAEMIQDYFGDGSQWDCKIAYLHETKRLGTAGALSLLPEDNQPEHIIVMNGDLLTTVDFRQVLNFHQETFAVASMCVKDYSIQVPYGVVDVDGHHFKGVKEKPAHQYYINAGMYILNSELLDDIQTNTYLDITDMFENFRGDNKPLSVFPMRENWVDIGNIADYEKATLE